MTESITSGLPAQLREVLRREILADDVEFDDDTNLLLEGLVDSLGVVQIVEWMEAQFSVEIDPADIVLDNFRSVGSMVAYVEYRVGDRTP